MKVLLMCVGSRGDAEPFCALAAQLLSSGHSVEFFVQPELQSLVPSPSLLSPIATSSGTATGNATIQIHPFPFTQYDFYKYAAVPSKGQDHENARVRFVGIVVDIIDALVFPCAPQVLEVAKTCDAIVTSALVRSLAFGLTKKLNIPTVLLHLQPLVPTRLFPHYSDTEACIAALLDTEDGSPNSNADDTKHLESYWCLEECQHEFLADSLTKLYREALDLPTDQVISWELTKTILSGNNAGVWLINAYSKELLPMELPDAGPHVQYTGALADHYVLVDFDPQAPEYVVLQRFLEPYQDSAPIQKPLCIGYGSMLYSQVTMMLGVLQELNQPAVLVGKALEVPSEHAWASKVCHVESVPYAWLLPQCQLMCCHGGAGVVHATLRAGIPLVIAPFFGDQFFFAELIQAKELGARAGKSLTAATSEDWKHAITKAQQCIEKAQEVGERIRGDPLGVDRLVTLLEGKVAVASGNVID